MIKKTTYTLMAFAAVLSYNATAGTDAAKDAYNKAKDSASGVYNMAKDSASDVYGTVGKTAKGVSNKINEEGQRMRDEARNLYGDANVKAEQMAEDAKKFAGEKSQAAGDAMRNTAANARGTANRLYDAAKGKIKGN